MKPRIAVFVVLALALTAALATPGPAAAKHFKSYASCGAKGKHAADFCFEGDHPVAVFRAFDKARVAYRFCFRKAGDRQHCRDRHTRKPGQLSRTRFDIDGSGKYKLAFFADGRAVDRDKLVDPRARRVRDRRLARRGHAAVPAGRAAGVEGEPVGLDLALRRRGRLDRPQPRRPAGRDRLRPRHQQRLPPGRACSATRSTRCSRIAGKTRCVVVPNIVRPPVGGASYAGFNQALADLAKHHDNLRVVDWAGLVRRNRGWLAGDGVHVNATGYRPARAAIAKQVERC